MEPSPEVFKQTIKQILVQFYVKYGWANKGLNSVMVYVKHHWPKDVPVHKNNKHRTPSAWIKAHSGSPHQYFQTWGDADFTCQYDEKYQFPWRMIYNKVTQQVSYCPPKRVQTLMPLPDRLLNKRTE